MTFIPIAIAESIEKSLPLIHFIGGDLYAHDDAPVIGPVIAIMENADIPEDAQASLDRLSGLAQSLDDLNPDVVA